VGSITKQFTGAAILALAEDGELRVEDPITAHFEGVPEDKRGITLHQLLTHSSGIVDLEGEGDWDPVGREEFVERILAQPLVFEPGTAYEYPNAGYSLLGAIVEQLTGGSYESFLRQRFFVPLGMFETGYVQAGWGEGRLAVGYRGEEPWGTVLGRPMADDGPYWVLRANGGIHTTAYDMLRWARALLEGRVLSAESLERLWAPHMREGEDADSFYGYGWAVLEMEDGTKVVTHNGGNGIFFADLALVPAGSPIQSSGCPARDPCADGCAKRRRASSSPSSRRK
jgi:CubicO group peptidase (beta-lactamase class C family)